MLSRLRCLNQLTSALSRSPAAVLLGPRQCGKTTLARQFAQSLTGSNSVEASPGNSNAVGPVTFFDCENPADVLRLAHAMTVLEPLRGLVVIDEAQRLPDLYPVLRVLIDRPDHSLRMQDGKERRDLKAGEKFSFDTDVIELNAPRAQVDGYCIEAVLDGKVVASAIEPANAKERIESLKAKRERKKDK